MSISINKLVTAALKARQRYLNVDCIGKDCGYSNSTLHRAIRRVEAEPFKTSTDTFPLFLLAVFLGMRIKGFEINLIFEQKPFLIRKGEYRGQMEALDFPIACTINKTPIGNGVELLNYFAGIEQPA